MSERDPYDVGWYRDDDHMGYNKDSPSPMTFMGIILIAIGLVALVVL